jgi:hypothetical protein
MILGFDHTASPGDYRTAAKLKADRQAGIVDTWLKLETYEQEQKK